MMVEIADSFDKIFGDFSIGDGSGISTLGFLFLGDLDSGLESPEVVAGEGRVKVSCGSGDGTFLFFGEVDLPAFGGDAPPPPPCPACASIL